ncbi:MAG: response regulator [Oligoflexus sp.]
MTNESQRILIVDDETQLVDIIAEDLKKEGYKVEFAYDGIEGLRQLEDHEFDLIISDINMPKMNGLEFLISIHERVYQVPTIILTAFGDYHAIRTAWKFGAFDFIEKPIDRNTLIEIVRIALTLGKNQPVLNQRSRFSHSVFRNIILKLDEVQYHKAAELAEAHGLSINSMFQELLESYEDQKRKKAS